jgi:hypothetical protein
LKPYGRCASRRRLRRPESERCDGLSGLSRAQLPSSATTLTRPAIRRSVTARSPSVAADGRSGNNRPVIGALVIAVIIVFLLPVAFLTSGAVGAAILGWLLKTNGEVTHEGSELIETNY